MENDFSATLFVMEGIDHVGSIQKNVPGYGVENLVDWVSIGTLKRIAVIG